MPSLTRCALFALFPGAAHGVEVDPVQVAVPIASNPGKEDFFQMVGFTSKILDGVHVNGHLLKIANGAGRLHFSTPLPGGCGTLGLPEHMGQLHDPQCKYVANAGYFDTQSEKAHSGIFDCIGNLVHDGHVVQTGRYDISNVQFGVKDGKYVIGYITPEEAQGFDQLIEGMGWLVRNGQNYVKPLRHGGLPNATGWTEAYHGAGAGGDPYVDFTTGRVTIGFNAEGELMILHTDGHTGHPGDPAWGAAMYEVADKLIELGAIEAINLDGGGSAQMYKNGVQIGYSSDRKEMGTLKGFHDPTCPIGNETTGLGPFECRRLISSFLCITEEPKSVLAGLNGIPSGMWLAMFGCLLAGAAVTWAILTRCGARKHSLLTEETLDEEQTNS